MRRIIALVVIALMVGTTFAPGVLGAETRTVRGFLRLDDDAPFDPNMTFNLSDPASTKWLNWNQTVEGFQNTSLNLTGAFTGPYLPPIEALSAVNRNDVETLTACGKVRFKTEWVMSGSSESWWRVPERGPYYGDNVNLTIWRVGSPDLLNFTNALVPNTASHPNLVFNYSYDLVNETMNKTFRWYNTTAWDHTFNSTWVRVVAPIHGDDFYAVRWQMTNGSSWAEHWLRFSQNDIGDDRDFSTWLFFPNNTREFIGADLDFSVIHTEGHGYSVWGTVIEDGGGGDAPTLMWNVTLEEPIEENDYLTVMVPFLETVDNSTNVLIGFGTQNDSWSTAFWVARNGPTDFGIKSVQWDVAWPATDMKIYMTIYNTSRRLWVVDRNTVNDPDVTWKYNHYSVEDHAWATGDYPFGGVPYHAMQVTNGSWENAEAPSVFYVGGREVRPGEKAVRKSEHSDDWYVELYVEGYEGVNRVIIAIGFALHGNWDKASAALNPEVPFPTDAGWFYGKYIFPAVWALQDFLGGIGERIWSALVWIYEGIQWIVANAPWIIAGTLIVITFFVIIPLWARFYRLLQGLIKFGWVLADQGFVAAAEFANAFWTEYISTSYMSRLLKRRKVV